MMLWLARWRRLRLARQEKKARQAGGAVRYRVLFADQVKAVTRDFRTLPAARELFGRLPHARKMLVDLDTGVLEQRGPAIQAPNPWEQNVLGADEPFAFF
jgi:hypothetical protein